MIAAGLKLKKKKFNLNFFIYLNFFNIFMLKIIYLIKNNPYYIFFSVFLDTHNYHFSRSLGVILVGNL